MSNEEEKTESVGSPESEGRNLELLSGKQDAPEEILKSDIKNMEVHHHPELEKKGFKEYLLEGLMIFLAVMLCFIAENIRENISENAKAKELAHSLYKEIYADSITVQQRMASRLVKENSCVYFVDYVKDSSLIEPPQQFFISFTNGLIQSAGILFEPNDGILNQLRNSGALRYFKNNDLQVQIGQLGVAIANIRNRNDKEYSFIELNVRPFSLRHFDFNWYDALIQHGKMLMAEALSQPNIVVPVKGIISNLDQFKRKEAENIASYYLLMLRGTRLNQYKDYAEINHRLMETLRKEYPIENEKQN
jgi:hypothetical protein